MYTGGLENHATLIGRMAVKRPLLGNLPHVLALARDPFLLAECCREARVPTPKVEIRPAPAAVRWLLKSRKGVGGTGVRFWDSGSSFEQDGNRFFQEFIAGIPASCIFVGTGTGATLLGMTRQLVGEPWLHAAPFHYCGSVGPLPLKATQFEILTRLGSILVQRCGMRGLFGLDGILRGDEFWPVEVNPRYTASVEVLEYATGLSALARHVQAFQSQTITLESPKPSNSGFIGKAILFAANPLTFPSNGPWEQSLKDHFPSHEMPSFADIPPAGERIVPGRPILTYFVRADRVENCLNALGRIAGELDRIWSLTNGY
jgi:predicted ATP-grasp superfamily ATP-dependent carboligase